MSTNAHWVKWGERDPYYAVATEEIYRGRHLSPDALVAFFRSGERDVAEMFATIETHIRRGFIPRSALDFGCGTGRTVIPLAAYCHVTGVDVSPAMLREAARNAGARGVTNVRLSDRIDGGPYDLVHAYIVFQHIPVRHGLVLTGRLLDALTREGIAVLHYVYASNRHLLSRMIGRTARRIPVLRGVLNLLRGQEFSDPPMEMNPYPLDRLLALFQEKAFAGTLIRYTNHGGSLGVTFYLWR